MRPLPQMFFFTDETKAVNPLEALDRLPKGAGVILRHYSWPNSERAALAITLQKALARDGGPLLLAGPDWRLGAEIGADGLHCPEWLARQGLEPGAKLWLKSKARLLTCAAHSTKALARAAQIKANAAFLSPLYPTASHPEAKALGPARFAGMSREAGLAVYALGGVKKTPPRRLTALGAEGYAAASPP